MVNIICTLIKYINIFLIVFYTYDCFSVFGYQDTDQKRMVLIRQNVVMYVFKFTCFLTMYLIMGDIYYIALYLALVILTVSTIAFYTNLYPKVSRVILNNMCMLLSIGFVILSRLTFDKAIKQFVIFCVSIIFSLFIPVIISKVRFLSGKRLRYVYASLGIFALFVVLVLAQVSDGAKLGFTLGNISIQPSEFVKIVFVFFVAACLYEAQDFKHVVITTALAATHVLILVVSTDLGAAVILFVVYLVMLYVGTRKIIYMFSGLLAGGLASVAAYHLFSHIQIRVEAWKDPFASYYDGGYQVAQSLLAIGTGGWFGMGLLKGAPTSIPVAEEDFVFAAISEELGLVFGICVILICISCYIMFLNVAMQLNNMFYKLIALGLGTSYIFQVFLTIGGVTKFIPSTGVTLPLISYGGSSLLSTLIMFAIIQGLYILREDEEEDIERSRNEYLRGEGKKKATNKKRSPREA